MNVQLHLDVWRCSNDGNNNTRHLETHASSESSYRGGPACSQGSPGFKFYHSCAVQVSKKSLDFSKVLFVICKMR